MVIKIYNFFKYSITFYNKLVINFRTKVSSSIQKEQIERSIYTWIERNLKRGSEMSNSWFSHLTYLPKSTFHGDGSEKRGSYQWPPTCLFQESYTINSSTLQVLLAARDKQLLAWSFFVMYLESLPPSFTRLLLFFVYFFFILNPSYQG